METTIVYFRVPTNQQQRSGLGIDAPRAATTRIAEAEGMQILAEYVDIETGKGANTLDRRPQLAALAAAKRAKCSVLVSKLDRLQWHVCRKSAAPREQLRGGVIRPHLKTGIFQ
ncbi:MAG TPA: recombinase family protein [Xanthobacteraceae bacterium]|nr:recombinase family protein [Xanthobacteraceae bacterium]